MNEEKKCKQTDENWGWENSYLAGCLVTITTIIMMRGRWTTW